ncbi:MAG: tetratricopeptide repeat protein [Bacteroidota bacterium]
MHTKFLALGILCFLTLPFVSSQACINETRHRLDGGTVEFEGERSGKVWPKQIDLDERRDMAAQWYEAYLRTDSIDYLSDHAANLIYLGEYERARQIYLQIEAKVPNRYATASNLGTAYELLGKNDSALFWIKRAVELNPAAHRGSEWIHVKILEHKVNPSADSLASILGLDFGDRAFAENPNQYQLDSLAVYIQHQLQERSFFIKAPNEIVGNLYFDFGNVVAQQWSIEAGIEAYKEAKRFGFMSPLLDDRHEALKVLSFSREIKQQDARINRNLIGYLILIGLFIALFVMWGRLRKMKR